MSESQKVRCQMHHHHLLVTTILATGTIAALDLGFQAHFEAHEIPTETIKTSLITSGKVPENIETSQKIVQKVTKYATEPIKKTVEKSSQKVLVKSTTSSSNLTENQPEETAVKPALSTTEPISDPAENDVVLNNYQPTELSAEEANFLLQASPNAVTQMQLFGQTETQICTAFDDYDDNILQAFVKHDISLINSPFVAVKYDSTSGIQYVQANYPEQEQEAAANFMADLDVVLAGKSTDSEKIQAVVNFIANHISYSTEIAAQDVANGGLKSQNLYIGNDKNITTPATDYGWALEAYYNGAGDCQEYMQLTELGLLYAGINVVGVTNMDQTLYDAAEAGNNQMHAWNQAQLEDGSWLTIDTTWYNGGISGESQNAQPWDFANAEQVHELDEINNINGLPIHTAVVNNQIQ